MWPLVAMAVLIGPMTYLSHRGLARFVCSGSRPDADITEVVAEHFGAGAGKFITLLYFLAIYPIVLIYGVGITNTVGSFMENQLGMTAPPRWILSGVSKTQTARPRFTLRRASRNIPRLSSKTDQAWERN